jgi:hypothetical protein
MSSVMGLEGSRLSKFPLYPEVHVSLRSQNRFALVSAIRLGLRRAGTPPSEIERFSQTALMEPDARRFEKICAEWVRLELEGPKA